MEIAIEILLALFAVGVFAGFIDTIAGGGGMLTIPALFMSGLPPEAALATNKLQASFGTTSAAFYFWRKGKILLRPMLAAIATTAIGAALGVFLLTMIPNVWLQKGIPVLLIIVALIFLKMPAIGSVSQEARYSLSAFALGAALPIGFYDGFLGPGTGSFFILALIAMRGKTLTLATMEAKVYNATSNLVSLLVFMLGGHIHWIAGLSMGGGQILGAKLASGVVMTRGSQIIRPMVIAMSIIMSLVLVYRYWL